jgi:hypothetical protein
MNEGVGSPVSSQMKMETEPKKQIVFVLSSNRQAMREMHAIGIDQVQYAQVPISAPTTSDLQCVQYVTP